MRHELSIILGEELRFLAIETRERLALTQKEMGEKLYMSESSYSDIETGRSHCGMLTAVLLLDMQNDPKAIFIVPSLCLPVAAPFMILWAMFLPAPSLI